MSVLFMKYDNKYKNFNTSIVFGQFVERAKGISRRSAQSCYPRNCSPALPVLSLRLRLNSGEILSPEPSLFDFI